MRTLYEQGLSADDVRAMFRLIDWLMDLPQGLKREFWREVKQIQEEKKMPYVSTPEWAGRIEGLTDAIRDALEIKFQQAGLDLMPEVEHILDTDQLRTVHKAVVTAQTLDDVRQVLAAAQA